MGAERGRKVKWLRQFSRTLPKPTKSECSPSRVSWLVLPIATMLAQDCREQLGSGVDDGRPFPLGFRLSPHLPRSKFNVAESAFHDLEPEEFVMLSPLPGERRRSQRLQAAPNQADLEWWDRSQKRSSQGNILNISLHGALVFCDSFPGLGENVLIRLKRPVRSDWTGSTVVRHDQQDEVAVDFNMGCPYDLVLAAALGIDIISSFSGLSGADRFSNSGD